MEIIFKSIHSALRNYMYTPLLWFHCCHQRNLSHGSDLSPFVSITVLHSAPTQPLNSHRRDNSHSFATRYFFQCDARQITTTQQREDFRTHISHPPTITALNNKDNYFLTYTHIHQPNFLLRDKRHNYSIELCWLICSNPSN